MRILVFALLLAACGSSKPKPEPEAEPDREPVIEGEEREEYVAPTSEETGGDPNALPAIDKSGIPPQCVRYVERMETCSLEFPIEARRPVYDAMVTATNAWREGLAGHPESTEQVDHACGQAVAQLKDAVSAACPNMKWD